MNHVAEFNIARARYPLDDPRMQDFMNALDAVNAVADRSPGFVWRLQGESGGATDIRAGDDPQLIVNLSVWETPEALERYVWVTVHKRVYNRKHEWFEPAGKPYFVMWPVAVGHAPDLTEAFDRLEHLRAHGSSEYAYGWDGLPHLKLWMTKQCG